LLLIESPSLLEEGKGSGLGGSFVGIRDLRGSVGARREEHRSGESGRSQLGMEALGVMIMAMIV
jgi:hypothetical protein